MKDVKKAVAQLLKEGAQRVENVVVKNVNCHDLDNYTRVSLTLNKKVKQYVANEDGEYSLGENNVIFVSAYSIGAILANSEDTAFAKNLLMKSPELLTLILSYATVDLVLEEVKAGDEYKNPFSDKDDTHVIEHDSIFVHIVSITLGKKGEKMLAKLESKMMDIMMAGAFSNALASDDEEE